MHIYQIYKHLSQSLSLSLDHRETDKYVINSSYKIHSFLSGKLLFPAGNFLLSGKRPFPAGNFFPSGKLLAQTMDL